MKKLFSAAIFIFCLSGNNFSQTKVFTFENEKKIASTPVPFGMSGFIGGGIVGNNWSNGIGGGINARIHYKFLTVEGFASMVDSRISLDHYPHSYVDVESTNYGCAIGVGIYEKYFSASVGIGPGRFESDHDVVVPEPGSYSSYVNKTVRSDAFAFTAHATAHLKGVGLSFQFTDYYSTKLNNYAFLFGIEFGILRGVPRN